MIEHHYGVLLIIGVSAFVGLFGSWFFQKIKFPQVVGYIVVGLLLGKSYLNLIDEQHFVSLRPLTFFALGLIGFLVGGELKISEFKKYGKQFMAILFGEGLAAFVLVGVSTTLLIYILSGNTGAALAGGIVLGAVASATDPASTISVLWEYRTKGLVTTSLIAIVALDDALAMSLYALGKSAANFIVASNTSISKEIFSVIIELSGSILLAILAAILLKFVIDKFHDKDKILSITVCTLFLIIGVCVNFSLDVILSSMVFGFIIANFSTKRTENVFAKLKSVSTPIYVIFFVLVGARFNIINVPSFVWMISLVYVICRSVGKFAGTWYCAKLSKSDEKIQKYTGLGLFAQGGVAIGLAIVASENLHSVYVTSSINLGDCIISVITVTTIAVQLLGPPMTKLAVKLAGELNKNITLEDVMGTMKLNEIIIKEKNPIKEDDSIEIILNKFSKSDQSIKTVVDEKNNFIGVVTFDSLRDALPDKELCQWILGADIMDDDFSTVNSKKSVIETINHMNDNNQYSLVVVDESKDNEDKKSIGIIELLNAKKIINRKLIEQML